MNDFYYPLALFLTIYIRTWGQWIITLNPPLLKWIHFTVRRFDFAFSASSPLAATSAIVFGLCLIETPSTPCCCKYFKHNLFIINKEQGSSTEQQREK